MLLDSKLKRSQKPGGMKEIERERRGRNGLSGTLPNKYQLALERFCAVWVPCEEHERWIGGKYLSTLDDLKRGKALTSDDGLGGMFDAQRGQNIPGTGSKIIWD